MGPSLLGTSRNDTFTPGRLLSGALALLAAIMLVGCVVPPAAPGATAPVPTRAASVTPGASVTPTLGVPTTTPSPAGLREIIILHTSDEHGMLLPQENGDTLQGGALLAAAHWTSAGLDPSDQGSNVLLLSGGDNWTGPAISTWFQGESTIEVMNALG